MKALVVFFDPEGARYEWALKVGFRHVFCVVDDGKNWIMVDGRDGRPVVEAMGPSDFDMKGFYENQEGYSVIEVERPEQPLRSPVVTVNCVGLVCAHLCIRAPFAFTPWQLYKHLKRTQHDTPRVFFSTPSRTAGNSAGGEG